MELVPLLRAGAAPPSRLRPSEDGFVVEERDLSVRQVVVVDDLFVSGARAMSAAAALERAGVSVRAVVPVARFVRPDHNDATAAYWRAFGGVPADDARCAICARGPAGLAGHQGLGPDDRPGPAAGGPVACGGATAVERLSA